MSFTDTDLADLYDLYGHVVYHRCLSILGNEQDARDAVQETFARVIRSGDGFREQSSPLTWMYRISTNYCLNQVRNRKGRQTKLTEHRQDIIGEGIERPHETSDFDHATLRGLLEQADEKTRACVIYTFFDDCTRQETANLVGLSVPTVRKRINLFLDSARRTLGVAAVAVLALTTLLWSHP
jgi:RNA polymerase sigma-70 factor (ECF subfamily)